MIIMHYSFTLPADYDMSIIRQRIQSNGNKLDGFPGLLCKAYLMSDINDPLMLCCENRYATLYVWQTSSAMNAFLQSSGFARLIKDFGWPRIDTWVALRVPAVADIKHKPYLAISQRQIPAHHSLSQLPLSGEICGWDVRQWQLLNVSFPEQPEPGAENYHIGYLAAEENTSSPT